MNSLDAALSAFSDEVSKVGASHKDGMGAALDAADAIMFSEAAIERSAKATYAEGAFCGTCEYEGWDACADCRRCNMDYARAVVAALREGA